MRPPHSHYFHLLPSQVGCGRGLVEGAGVGCMNGLLRFGFPRLNVLYTKVGQMRKREDSMAESEFSHFVECQLNEAIMLLSVRLFCLSQVNNVSRKLLPLKKANFSIVYYYFAMQPLAREFPSGLMKFYLNSDLILVFLHIFCAHVRHTFRSIQVTLSCDHLIIKRSTKTAV